MHNTSASLEQLPQEIFLEICHYLPPRRELLESFREETAQYSPLSTLSECSKKLAHLVTPLLYAEFAEIGSIRRLPLFLRTILSRPDLAQHVKSFSGCNFEYKPWIVKEYDHKPTWDARVIDRSLWSLDDQRLMKRAVLSATERFKLNYHSYPKRVDETFVNRWLKRLFRVDRFSRASNWDAVVALLLCHLPNLQKFRLEAFNDDRQHARDGTRGFDFILRVLRSSKIDGSRIWLEKLDTAQLEFTNCVQRKRLLQCLAQNLAPLKNFSYKVIRPLSNHRPGSHSCRATRLDLSHLRKRILKLFEPELEVLEIVMRYGRDQALDFGSEAWEHAVDFRYNFENVDFEDARFMTPIGPLDDFKKLRKLKVMV
ncbi:hypothetical protein EG329_007321 [Mollisiaceae sp. DMI_Dod_QoI]|nr:hypothetical protein EG329_007321 [Helotiales sp. DMI_Dod_QoI]